MTMANTRRAVVVILGSTGTGKSKLAIEIAKKFYGEIISADSMQVYKGLDIITNKVTEEEKLGTVHHLLDFVNPSYHYSVTDFQSQALNIIDRILGDEKLPVIVGGTNYYIESLLWKVLIPGKDKDDKSPQEDGRLDFISSRAHLSDNELHDELKLVDLLMASRLHPGNRRKVLRSLEIFEQHNRTHSEFIADQKLLDGGNSYGAPLRFNNSLIIWINSEVDTLNKRLDDRVEAMMNLGLLKELESFHHKLTVDAASKCMDNDYTHGILQSIGFKEFHDYLMLPIEERKPKEESVKKLIENGKQTLKLVTRRYARKQIKWIRNRFLKKPKRQVPPVYMVDSTDVEKWNENVLDPASRIVEAYLNGLFPDVEPVPIDKDAQQFEEKNFYCDICERIIVGELQWDSHIKSKRHKKVARSKQIKMKNSAF